MNKSVLYHNQEVIAFLEEYVPGHWWTEIYQEFQKRFPQINISLDRLRYWSYRNLKVRNGMDGEIKKGMHFAPETEFQKGQEPIYVVPKGTRLSPGTEFKKGHLGVRTVPIGTEKNVDGYVLVKIRERGPVNRPWKRWKPKAHIVWEQAHGPIPAKHVVMFINGDKNDCQLENLRLIPKRVNACLNNGLRSTDSETLETAIALSELKHQLFINSPHARYADKLRKKKEAERMANQKKFQIDIYDEAGDHILQMIKIAKTAKTAIKECGAELKNIVETRASNQYLIPKSRHEYTFRASLMKREIKITIGRNES